MKPILDYAPYAPVTIGAGYVAYRRHVATSEKTFQAINTFPAAEIAEMVTFADRTIDYVQEQGVGAIALVDVAARPFYIPLSDACERRGIRRPPIFFLNPQGFQAREDDPMIRLSNTFKAIVKSDRIERSSRQRTSDEIVADIPKVYPALYKRREEPLLVMDTCMHTGMSVGPMLSRLETAGFTDVSFGVAHYLPRLVDKEKEPPVPDLILGEERPLGWCYPFGRDRAVQKTYVTLHSRAAASKKRIAIGSYLRRSLKHAISFEQYFEQ